MTDSGFPEINDIFAGMTEHLQEVRSQMERDMAQDLYLLPTEMRGPIPEATIHYFGEGRPGRVYCGDFGFAALLPLESPAAYRLRAQKHADQARAYIALARLAEQEGWQ